MRVFVNIDNADNKHIISIPLDGCDIQGRKPSPINGDSACRIIGILSSIEFESVNINSPLAIIPCFNSPLGEIARIIGSPGEITP